MDVRELTGFPLIDSPERAASWPSGPTFRATNPATGLPLEPAFREADGALVDRAARMAATAFRVESAASTGVDSRAKTAGLLEAIAGSIESLGPALLARASEETALPIARFEGERARTIGQLRQFAALVREGSWVDAILDSGDPTRAPIPKPDLRRALQPIGPVAVFGASNFPLAFGVAGGDTAAALAAGNPVIAKGHPLHPGTNELVARAIVQAVRAAGFPDGWFSLLQGSTPALSLALVEHPAIEAVGFTGSLAVGRTLFDAAGRRPRPIPVYAEMGSANPLVILPGALSARGDTIARDLAASVTLGVGQFCTKPGLVFLLAPEAKAASAWLARFGETLQATSMGAMLSRGMRDRFCRAADERPSLAGVTELTAAAPAGDADGSSALRARAFATDIRSFLATPSLHEEMFGPGVLVVTVATLPELEVCLEAVGGALTGTLHADATDAPTLVTGVADALARRVGRLVWNGYPTGVEVAPAMMHGGPYPATTHAGSTSVGTTSIRRFARPLCFQNTPQALLPLALRDGNPLGIVRQLDGVLDRP